MAAARSIPQYVLAYAVCLALAVVLGFMLATPTELFSFVLIMLVFLGVAAPLLMRWHYPMLVFGINAAFIVYILPGQPNLWMLLAGLSLGFAWLERSLTKESVLLRAPSVSLSLLALAMVVLVTAQLTGGIGFRSFGSGVYGGKRYFVVLASIAAFFALISRSIPREKANRYVALYYLSGLTCVMSNVVYMLGPSFYTLYALFPVDLVLSQAAADYELGPGVFARMAGLSFASVHVMNYMLARYNLGGLLEARKPWRLLLFIGFFGLSLLGGFRSVLALYFLVFLCLLLLEKIYRTPRVLMLLGAGIVAMVIVILNARSFPLSVQRSLSVLPFVEVDPVARFNAQASSQWRFEMWDLLWPQVPKYLLLGKGFAIDATEFYLVQESVKRGLAYNYEEFIVSGDYHNGPLSVLLPLGLWGGLAFLWFIIASMRVLYRNYKYGDPALRTYNTFFLAFFIAKFIFFVTIFGALNSDLIQFAGIVGLGIALNGGVAKPAGQR